MGEMPDWYMIVAAARYLGVPPWDLLDRPKVWVEMAIDAMSAEAHAREMQNRVS